MSLSEQKFDSTNHDPGSLPTQFHCLVWCSNWELEDNEGGPIQSPFISSPWDHWGKTQNYTMRVEIPSVDASLLSLKLLLKTKKDHRNEDEDWEQNPALYDEMTIEWFPEGHVNDGWMMEDLLVFRQPMNFFPKLLNQCGGCTFPGHECPDLITLSWHDFACIQKGQVNWLSLPEEAARTVTLLLESKLPIGIWVVIDIYPHTKIYQEKWYNPLKVRLSALQEIKGDEPSVTYPIQAGQRFISRAGAQSVEINGPVL